MEDGLLRSGEGKEQTLLKSGEGKEQTPAVAAAATSLLLGMAFLVSAIAFAAFVLYVTGIYTHSWMEKLQMLPLCIVAVTPPMLWARMFRKGLFGSRSL